VKNVVTLDAISQAVESIAPSQLAEPWDNVGLLVGDPSAKVRSVMTCLTITPEVVDEALAGEVDVIVTHHPLPFKGVKSITPKTYYGKMLWKLISNRVAVISAHTAYDSSLNGLNQQWAENLGLSDIRPLIAKDFSESMGNLGAGRFGKFTGSPVPLTTVVERCKKITAASMVKIVGQSIAKISTVAVACGSAGEFMETAVEKKADCFITGEASFHTCLEAKAAGLNLILVGHYRSERFGLESLAKTISGQFPDIPVWASRQESNPIDFV